MIRNYSEIGAENLDQQMAKFKFLNGDIDVPMSYGGYVIASGCGSGKTTVIKDIIRQKWYEGILYSAATIRECNEMYEYCKTLIGSSASGYVLESEDIIVVHSQNKGGIETFMDEPLDIKKKKIVICTHHKLLHEYPEILLDQDFNVRHFSSMYQTGLRASVSRKVAGLGPNSVYYLPRQWVLVDELPICEIMKSKFEKVVTSALMREVDNTQIAFDPVTNSNVVVNYDVRHEKFPTYLQMEKSYDSKIKGTSLEIAKGDREIDKLRTKLSLETYYENYDTYNPNSEIKEITVKYNITDLLLKGMETRFLIFDGTGDLTFFNANSRKFVIRSMANKYSSPITYKIIDNHIDRDFTEKFIINHQDELYSRLGYSTDSLLRILCTNNKVLIVCWKDLRLKYGNLNKGSVILNSSSTERASLPQYYTEQLCCKLGIQVKYNQNGSICTLHNEFGENKEFSIIHYQSGLDKATNDFRDYDAVVLLGNFYVPESVIREFNEVYECETSHLKYTTYQLVQAICRTRIRNHLGEPIDVYFTNDWEEGRIRYLNMYLSNNPLWANIVNADDPTLSYKMITGGGTNIGKLVSRDFLSKVRPKWKDAVKILSEYDGNIIQAIVNGSGYTVNIKIGEIRQLIPMAKKEPSAYVNLKRYLANDLNIILNILSA